MTLERKKPKGCSCTQGQEGCKVNLTWIQDFIFMGQSVHSQQLNVLGMYLSY